MSRSQWDTLFTGILAAVAIVILIIFVLDRNDRRTAASTAPRLIDDWEEANEHGIWIGSRSAPVVVTEFIDFQCPYCRALMFRKDTLLQEFPDKIAFVMHHYPLPRNDAAIPAAIAAECADRQGRFVEMYRGMLEMQDSIGLKGWVDFARAAGIPNLEAFTGCIRLPVDSFPRIVYGLDLGSRAGVRGTPTVWVNGRVIGSGRMQSLRSHAAAIVGVH
jgi:protein-disulfide isomerase